MPIACLDLRHRPITADRICGDPSMFRSGASSLPGRKIYSLHAHEVECIDKGRAHATYEFGVKVSVATTLKRSKGASSPCMQKRCPAIPYMRRVKWNGFAR